MLFIISSLIPTFLFVIITYLKSYEIIFDEPLISHQSLKLSLFVLGTICVTLSFFTIRLFGNSIINALKQFQEAADAIRRGDFSHVLPRFTNKEMNELRSSFNQIVEKLKDKTEIL